MPDRAVREEAATSRCKDVGRQAMHTARESTGDRILIDIDIYKLRQKINRRRNDFRRRAGSMSIEVEKIANFRGTCRRSNESYVREIRA